MISNVKTNKISVTFQGTCKVGRTDCNFNYDLVTDEIDIRSKGLNVPMVDINRRVPYEILNDGINYDQLVKPLLRNNDTIKLLTLVKKLVEEDCPGRMVNHITTIINGLIQDQVSKIAIDNIFDDYYNKDHNL